MLCIDTNDLLRNYEYVTNMIQIKEEKVKRKTGYHCSNVSSKACNSEKSGIEWWHEP